LLLAVWSGIFFAFGESKEDPTSGRTVWGKASDESGKAGKFLPEAPLASAPEEQAVHPHEQCWLPSFRAWAIRSYARAIRDLLRSPEPGSQADETHLLLQLPAQVFRDTRRWTAYFPCRERTPLAVTVMRDWSRAKAWLYRELTGGIGDGF
jgi:hypothetical protein